MSQVVTNAGEALLAQKAQANEQLDIDTFIFAYVPGQDSQAPVDRSEGLPPIAQQVHTQPVQQVGRINNNTVVYSTVLNSLTGPFEFNWVGLYSSVNNTLVAISHVKSVNKTITELGNAGNTLNRNFAIEYSGISNITGITVAPETWQLDFSARLAGMDALTQNLAMDMNGRDWFIGDGFKVEPTVNDDEFRVIAGVGYVHGMRVKLEQDYVFSVQSYPQNVYVDVWFEGDASSQWKGYQQLKITNTEMGDYVDSSGEKHYQYKLAIINESNFSDLRELNGLNDQVNRIEKFENLAVAPPVAPEINEGIVFVCFASDDFNKMFSLYPCSTGNSYVLDSYEKGAVANNDAFNVGGVPCHRVLRSFVVKKALCVNLNPFYMTAAVINGNDVSTTVWDNAMGVPSNFSGAGSYKNGENSFSNRKSILISDIDEYVEYEAYKKTNILFIKSASGCENVEIYTDLNGGYELLETISLLGSGHVLFECETGSKIKIKNNGVGKTYIIGASLNEVRDANIDQKYDSVAYWREDFYAGATDYWIGPGEGANDFALKEKSGRFFGSYHGGHFNEVVTLYVNDEQMGVDDVAFKGFRYAKSATIKSESTLRGDNSEFNCIVDVTYFKGGHRIYGNLNANTDAYLNELFVAMTVSHKRFDKVTMPTVLNLDGLPTGTEILLGDVNYVIQTDPSRNHSIRTDMTKFDSRYSSKKGPYIQARAADNKLYNNPLEDSGRALSNVSFETYHRFYS